MSLIEHIKEKTNNDVVFVYKTGASLFCNRCKDNDIVVVTNYGDDYRRLTKYEDYDIFCYSLDGIKKYATMEVTGQFSLYLIAFALAKNNNIIYGVNPLPNFNLLEYRDKLVRILIDNAKRYDCNKNIKNRLNKSACLKQSIWLFANYFSLVNNSLELTEGQLDIIQKCHDNELPRSYAEDLYQKLLEMLPKQEEQDAEQPTISYDDLVDSKIRARYTASQEFAILRQRDTKPDEFAEYNEYCEQCKAEAKAELGIE